jgi:acetaldehyde dehydrogenase/alcohol dehydrogenase
MAFANAFLGLCHSMAHKLGAAFHVAHGVANGILITHVVRYNATPAPLKQAAFPQYTHPVALLRYARVADLLALGGNSDEEKTDRLIKALEKLRAELNIPATFREAGVPEEAFLAQLDQISILAFDDQCTGCNPRYPLIEEIKELFLGAYYGDSPRNSRGAA